MGKLFTRFDDIDVVCPFFKASNEKQISCEGIAEESILILSFNNKKDRNFHKTVFCDKKCENCEIYRMLEKKYED